MPQHALFQIFQIRSSSEQLSAKTFPVACLRCFFHFFIFSQWFDDVVGPFLATSRGLTCIPFPALPCMLFCFLFAVCCCRREKVGAGGGGHGESAGGEEPARHPLRLQGRVSIEMSITAHHITSQYRMVGMCMCRCSASSCLQGRQVGGCTSFARHPPRLALEGRAYMYLYWSPSS